MRIFFFITKSEQGGAQTHVAQLTRWLVEHGHEVTVMSTPGGWLYTETRRLGGRFIPNDDLGNTLNLFRLWKVSRRFLDAIDEFHPDVVACHSTMAGLIGRFALRGRVPTIFTAHGWGFTQGAPRLRRWILPIFERLAGKYAKKIICVSRNDLELAGSNHIAAPDKLVQIYNGIEVVQTIPDTTQAKAWGYQPKDGIQVHIFFVGRLAPPKNPFLLVEAFACLNRELQERTRITIIGDGPDREKLERLIRAQGLVNRVELTGALPREQVLARLRTQADIFVLVSAWEGFPYSILEAMNEGVPVIASSVGGIPEALEHGGGILLKHEDPKTLAQTITLLIQDEPFRLSLASQASLIAQQRFSVKRMCERTSDLYQEVINGSEHKSVI